MWAGRGRPRCDHREARTEADFGQRRAGENLRPGDRRERKQVEDYRAGKEKAFNSLVGQAMKLTKGKANPQQVSEILKRKLSG